MPCDGSGSDDDDSKPESKGPNPLNIGARIAAMGLAVASAALMATASQCTIVLPYGAPAHTVTYSDFGPFVYLVVANAIAALMVAVAIFLSVWKKGGEKCSKVLLPLLDAAAPALLYSATGAAFATAQYMSYCLPNARRVDVCAGGGGRASRNFCSQVHLSIYISLAAAAAVSAAEMVKNVALSLSGGGSGSGSGCDSDSGSEDGCGHGCHHKH